MVSGRTSQLPPSIEPTQPVQPPAVVVPIIVAPPAPSHQRRTIDGFSRPLPKPTPPKATIAPATPLSQRIVTPTPSLIQQAISPPVDSSPTPPKAAKKQKKKGKPWVLYALAAFIFLAGIGILLQGFLVNKDVQTQAKALSQETQKTSADSALPSEEKPDEDVSKYHVGPMLPRIITIDAIGIKARIKQVDVAANNELQTPQNVHDAAWYTGSSKPGEHGAVLLNGHYGGPTQPGVFASLGKLAAGSVVQIERGDGTMFTYTVKRVETINTNAVNMASLLISQVPNQRGLNMITCAGKYDAAKNEYSQRTIVYTVEE